VGVQDLTALYYNPGALARIRGTHALYHHNLIFHQASFERATLSDVWGADSGTTFERVEDGETLAAFNPFAVVASDFGLDSWTFAAGVFGPSAVGRHDYPEYGPQAFMLTDMDIVIAYYSLAAAWQIPRRFGVGITVQYVDLSRLDYGLVVDGAVAEDLNPVPDPDSTQLVTKLELRDRTAATALVGLWGRPHPNIEVGLGGRVIPVFWNLQGGVATDKPTLVTDELEVEMPLTLPAQVRGGVRYVHERHRRELFDVELDLVWENYAAIEAYEMSMEGRISGQEVENMEVVKDWRDTYSLRLGGDVHLLGGHLSLRAGGLWESGASPESSSHLDFPSFMRGGIAAGISGGHRGVHLTVGYMHIFQEEREVTELGGKAIQQRPLSPCPGGCAGLTGVPANAGVFESSYDMLGLGLDVDFGALAGVRRSRRAGATRASAPTAARSDPRGRPRRSGSTPR
jgi:long-subunit fatty acid transport protein